ncbi:MAG: hypothetical protein HYX63_02375 [Gammaproteobacteria bacterium]|nr:hypothetical protein [Gammaproteobacteria bacterium]
MGVTEINTEPDVTMLMISIIRLLAIEHADACEGRRATLTRLLNYLGKHPAVRRAPDIAATVRSALAIWNGKLIRDEFFATRFDAATDGFIH